MFSLNPLLWTFPQGWGRLGRHRQVVRQESAKLLSPVRIWVPPPDSTNRLYIKPLTLVLIEGLL